MSRDLIYNHGAKKTGSLDGDVYYTPRWFTEKLTDIFPGGFHDPCPGQNNIPGSVPQERDYTSPGNFYGVRDGLKTDWLAVGLPVFVNPPFSDLHNWIKKINLEADRCVPIVYFGKLDYRTKWGCLLISTAKHVTPILGYTKYLDEDGSEYSSATFQSCFALWNLDIHKFSYNGKNIDYCHSPR